MKVLQTRLYEKKLAEIEAAEDVARAQDHGLHRRPQRKDPHL